MSRDARGWVGEVDILFLCVGGFVAVGVVGSLVDGGGIGGWLWYVGFSEKSCRIWAGGLEVGLVEVEVEDKGCFLIIYSGPL